MKLCVHNRNEPGFNLACEEYFLTQTELELDIFWRNSPVVVIGRNQDAEAEVYADYMKRNGIALMRRITGGGAVYHDLGNICYTHVRNYDGPVDLRRFCETMVETLGKLGLDASFAGKNDILIGGKKVSGAAQTIIDGRLLHHGTLLYDTDMSHLTSVLRVSDEKYKGRGIASVAARVTNIKPLLADGPDVDEFIGRLIEAWPGTGRYELSGQDIEKIEALRRDRYDKEKWICAGSRD
jgi:lipoate-protein ligase A